MPYEQSCLLQFSHHSAGYRWWTYKGCRGFWAEQRRMLIALDTRMVGEGLQGVLQDLTAGSAGSTPEQRSLQA
jgi:hypothetical protein